MADEFNREILRAKITAARKKLELNQAQLAEKAGITPAAISQIEAGDRTPSLPVLQRIAQVLRVSVNYLLGETDKSEIEDILQNGDVKQFFRDFENLSPEDQHQITWMMDMLKQKQNKK